MNPKLWRVIPGFPLYEAHPDGFIRCIGNSKCLKATPGGGYLKVGIRDDANVRRYPRVHVLILQTFVGPRPSPEHEGAHCDGDPWNNALFNLAWKTRQENTCDKRVHRTTSHHAGAEIRRMRPEEVIEVRMRAAQGEPFARIARDFDVHRSSISRIARGLRYPHIKPSGASHP